MKNSLTGFYSLWLLIVMVFGSIYPPVRSAKETNRENKKTVRKPIRLTEPLQKPGEGKVIAVKYPDKPLKPGNIAAKRDSKASVSTLRLAVRPQPTGKNKIHISKQQKNEASLITLFYSNDLGQQPAEQ